jgi:hypothetical protein
VGYHERNLLHYRKLFTVDFDYNREFLNDEVYMMNEVTNMRIFGATRDVRSVNTSIIKELENLKFKSVFL